jgi:queuine tRNA-ribosyltransferase
MNLRNNKWKDDFSPLDPDGTCFVDWQYSKAYLRHLFISGEILATRLLTLHNVFFYMQLTRTAREHIINGTFTEWSEKFLAGIENGKSGEI